MAMQRNSWTLARVQNGGHHVRHRNTCCSGPVHSSVQGESGQVLGFLALVCLSGQKSVRVEYSSVFG